MRKLLLLISAILVSGSIGCSKCSPEGLKGLKEMMPGGGETKATMAADQIGGALAPVICEKYSTCNPAPDFNKDQCLKDISTGITENLKQTQDLKVDQAALDACTKAIQASACEALNSATPPAGCEFLQ